MKPILFVLVLLASAVLLVPDGKEVLAALRTSKVRAEAEDYLRSRRAKAPDDPEVIRQLLRILRQRGAREEELALRSRLRELLPEDAANLEELLAASLGDGRLEEAVAAAEALLVARPDRRDVRERLLELHEWRGRPGEARPHAEWLLRHGLRSPRLARVFQAARDPEALASAVSCPAERARLFVAMGEHPRAIDALRERLREDPADVAARRDLARLHLWGSRPLEAAMELRVCLRHASDPDLRGEFEALCRGLNRIDLLVDELPDGMEKADFLLALGRIAEARTLYARLGNLDKLLELSQGVPADEEELTVREAMPASPANLRRLADLYYWRKEFDRALELYERVGDERVVDLLLHRGDRPGALAAARRLGLGARQGEIHLWAGDLAAAIEQFEKLPAFRRELPSLYIRTQRPADAVRLLRELEDMDPYVRAELFVHAGRGDLGAALIEGLDGEGLDLHRVEHLARASLPETSLRLHRLLLRHRPGDRDLLLALAGLLEDLGRKDEALRILKELAARFPNEAELLARLGLLSGDRASLERARLLGCRRPDVLRALAGFAYEERRWAEAVELFREYLAANPGDYEARFLLAELTDDAAEYARVWAQLPPGERTLRLRILLWRKDLDGALALIREVEDARIREALVDLLLEAGREEEALALGLSVRQQAVLAIRRGRFAEAVDLLRRLDAEDPAIRRALAESLLALGRLEEADALIPGIARRHQAVRAMAQGRYAEAVEILRGLDLSDPAIRRALAEALLAAGRWQEAERHADPALARQIRGRYGPEGSGQAVLHDAPDERDWTFAAAYRLQVSEALHLRVRGAGASYDGTVAVLGEERSAALEWVEASAHVGAGGGLTLGAGAGAWAAEGSGDALGLAEAEIRSERAYLFLRGDGRAPWKDSLETAVLEGTRHQVSVQGGIVPWKPLFLSAGADWMAYEARAEGLEGEAADEIRARLRAEWRFWASEAALGPGFFDLSLRDEAFLQSFVGVFVQGELAETGGSEALLSFAQLIPSSRLIALGPTAGWANRSAGIAGSFFVAQDGPRDFAWGDLWGGSLQGALTVTDGWRLVSAFEYISEQRQADGGAGWTWTAGFNVNF